MTDTMRVGLVQINTRDDKDANLRRAEELWQRPPDPRRPQRLRRIRLRDPFARRVPEQASQTRQAPRNRRSRVVALVQIADVRPQHRDIDLLDRRRPAHAVLQEIREAVQVLSIRLQRQLRSISLKLQVSQETLDG